MSTDRVDFTGLGWDGVEWTMLGTLYLRAYESRSEHPILADHIAAETMERVDFDVEKLKRKVRPESNQFLVAVRAKQLDQWASDFLARSPEATVLHLGCGLDSRVFRLAPPSGVRWFDVDLPHVIELRRKLYTEREGYQMIGSSVTDPEWLEEVPADRPTLVIAEGLLMYLTESELRELLQRVTGRFPTGELLFDGLAPWMPRWLRNFQWGVRDGAEVERLAPRLRFVTEVRLGSHHPKIPVRRYRLLYRLMDATPGMRNMMRQFRFRF